MELRNVGDVQICVYINHTLVYHSIQHDSNNITEFERVKATGLARYDSMQLPEVSNPDDIIFKDYNLFVWNHGFSLYPTQSLGHKGITGIFPEVKIIEFSEQDDIVVIVATDGLWDVVNPTYDVLHSYTSEELANLAETRWKKSWNIIDNKNPQNIVKNNFTKADDIGIAVWRRSKNI
jgi:serine/threonine protein phosphatase PrpC